MLVIHRNILAEHILDEGKCWCDPLVVEDDDLRTNQQIHEESLKRDLKH